MKKRWPDFLRLHAKPGLWALIGLAILLAACAPAVQTAPPKDTITPFPTSTATASLTPTASNTPTTNPTPTLTPPPTPAVLAGAGDISICGQEGDDQTAALLKTAMPDAVFTAGDNTNGSGTFEEYITCFDASWGYFRHMIRPAPGNHDYYTEKNAQSYFQYFGEAAGEPGKGYYSWDLGDWHLIALNSNCLNIDGCGPDSPQVQWLREDLQANRDRCVLAYWHHPRWTSGLAGNSFWLQAFWDALYEYGAEIVVSGHDHNYERFAPAGPAGQPDPERGIRQFVVGTGGASQRGFAEPLPFSEVRNSGDFGILLFRLYPDRYEWEFIPVEGGDFRDSGSGQCHKD